MKIQLKRSNVLDGGKAKQPTAEQMEYGELAVNYNTDDPSIFLKDSDNNIVNIIDTATPPGDGTITIKQPGTSDQTFTVNQTGNTEITLKNDDTIVTPGNGALTIESFGSGASSTGTFTANQSAASTITLPQISYTDLSNIPALRTIGDGTITIKQPGTDDQTFTVNQTGDTEINLKNDNTVVTPGNGTITIKQPGTSDQSFTVNQTGNTEINLKNDNTQVTPGNGGLTIKTAGEGATSTGTYTANQTGNTTLTLPTIRYTDLSGKPSIPAAAGNGTITIVQPGTSNQTFTVNQSGNTTITLKNDNTVPSVGNGALTIKSYGSLDNSTGTFTANQSSGSSITLPQISYTDLKDTPPAGAAPGNGTITVTQPGTSPQTFTVNQSGNTTIALKNDNTVPSVGDGTITISQPGTSNQTFTVNQGGNKTITLKNDNTTYTAGDGLSLSGTSFLVDSTVVRTSGNQSIGGAKTFTSNVTVNGAITASGDVTAFSDISLKENIEVIPDALNKLSQLRGVTYNRKDLKTKRQTGVIAQEVEAVVPEVVYTDEEGIKSVAYGNLVGLLIESIKELKAEIDLLKAEKN